LGAEIFLEGLGADPLALSRVMVLVQSSQGYLNLSELLARAWTQNMVEDPRCGQAGLAPRTLCRV
jgi:DNA polymerase-3 subunit alpha